MPANAGEGLQRLQLLGVSDHGGEASERFRRLKSGVY